MESAPTEPQDLDLGGWDVHTHLVPAGVVTAAERNRFGMHVAAGKLNVCGHGVPLQPIGDVDRLADRIASDRLDGAIVSVPPPLFRPDLGNVDRRDYASFVNEALLETCGGCRGILRPLAYLPAEDPELASELAGTLDNSWAGVVMGTDLGSHTYADAAYDALWSTLGARRLPLFIHPGSSPDPRLDRFYLSNLLGNPVETTVAAAHLVFGGVMERYPELTIILAHGGGCVAALAGRWQRGAMTQRPGVGDLKLDPLKAVSRFYVDTIVHSPAYLAAIFEIVGEGRVLLGSDWPFPMGAPAAEHDLGSLAPSIRHQTRTLNPKAAFGERLLYRP